MRKRIFSGSVAATTAALLCLAAAPARAEEPKEYNNWEFTPFVGYMAGGEFEDPIDDSNRDLQAGTSYGLIIDAAAEWWRHYEMLYLRQSTEVDGFEKFDMDVEYLQFGGTVAYPDAEYTHVIPYIGMNPHVGLLFIDFEAGKRIRLNGTAALEPASAVKPAYVGAQFVVRVSVREVFPNCPRYIHKYQLVERSKFVPRADVSTPVPAWKRYEWAKDVLPEGDPAKD